MNWCAYQERSQFETRRKLRELGAPPEFAELMITELIAENFLNEQRFALALAGGKFRVKRWGRNKIKAELKRHQVSGKNIETALDSIDEDEYRKALNEIIIKKSSQLKQDNKLKTYRSLYSFLTARGFESELVNDTLKQINSEPQDDEF